MNKVILVIDQAGREVAAISPEQAASLILLFWRKKGKGTLTFRMSF